MVEARSTSSKEVIPTWWHRDVVSFKPCLGKWHVKKCPIAYLEPSSNLARKNTISTPCPVWRQQDCLTDPRARSRQMLHGGTAQSTLSTAKQIQN